MLNIRPDWLPDNEDIVAYCASSARGVSFKTRSKDGHVTYIWRKIRPKRARRARFMKVSSYEPRKMVFPHVA